MMTDFDIASHVVLAQGLSSGEDLRAWAQAALPGMPEGLPDAPLAFTKRLPMMKARRMSPGARLACEAALALEGAGEAKAWIFSSRHGETVRGVKILDAISAGEPPSPTDFMMSVHNAARHVHDRGTGARARLERRRRRRKLSHGASRGGGHARIRHGLRGRR